MFHIILIYILMWKTTSQSSLILSCIASEEIARCVKKKNMKNIWNINKGKKHTNNITKNHHNNKNLTLFVIKKNITILPKIYMSQKCKYVKRKKSSHKIISKF